jgi:hypothetical protein
MLLLCVILICNKLKFGHNLLWIFSMEITYKSYYIHYSMLIYLFIYFFFFLMRVSSTVDFCSIIALQNLDFIFNHNYHPYVRIYVKASFSR